VHSKDQLTSELAVSNYNAVLSDEELHISSQYILISQENVEAQIKDALLKVKNAFGSKLMWNAKADAYQQHAERFTM